MASTMKCTILIPTYNRPAFLRRLLTYYATYDPASEIIIADSSSDECKKKNEETANSLKNLKIMHLGYPQTIDPGKKVSDAVTRVGTKYCLMCADDDITSANGIQQSVDFLEKNADFVVAMGFYIRYWLTTEGSEKQFSWSAAYLHKSNEAPSPVERLHNYIANFMLPTMYGVHRTETMKMILKETANNTDDVMFGELIWQMLIAIQGKTKCLDVLYSARDSPATLSTPRKTLFDFIEEGSYDRKYSGFSSCLSHHLSAVAGIDREKAQKIIDDEFSIYMNRYRNHTANDARINEMKAIMDRLRLSWIYNGLRPLYKKIVSPRSAYLASNAPPLLDNPSSKYYTDFDAIRHIILAHSE